VYKRQVFEFYESFLNSRQEMKQDDFNTILHNLVLYQQSRNKQYKRRKIIYMGLRVAAVVAVMILSYGLLQYFSGNSAKLQKFAETTLTKGDESVITLSDGTEHVIGSNDAFIDYKNDNNKIVVEESTEEKIVLDKKAKNKKNQLNQVYVPYGKQQRLMLSDGTLVYLNSGSKLVYPANFGDGKREVFLSGEGYFEVQKDEHHPFIVQTNSIDIQVLGTKFNVSSYDDEKVAHAILVEGSVKVLKDKNIFITDEYYLHPNEGFFFSHETKDATVKNVDTDHFTSWKNGIFQFNELTFNEVIQKVKKYYNRNIEIENNSYSNTLITGKLYLNNDIRLVIESLSRTVEASYVENENGVFVFQ
jgi:ferric-dicitrate binding protein FerR (iron transport regulator)